ERGGWSANWWMRTGLGRWLNEKLFGIDRRRVPPALAPTPFVDGSGHLVAGPRDPDAPEVLLFPDTFMNQYEPGLGTAAQGLLAAVGWRVIKGVPLPGDVFPRGLTCCGRPLISNGLLDEALERAETNVRVLYLWAAAGKFITACEPSCLLTLKDDYPA